jgi:hypothetical protein
VGKCRCDCVITVSGLEPGISPVTRDLQCQTSRITGNPIAESCLLMDYPATMNAISRADRHRDPASMD